MTETEKLIPADQWKVRELQKSEEDILNEESIDGEPESKKMKTDDETMT